MLRLFCDQNILVDTVIFLRKSGYDVLSTRDLGMERAQDSEVLQAAIEEERILLTYNSDFGDLRAFPPETHAGIIRLKIHPQVCEVLHPILKKALFSLAQDQIAGKLVTITPKKIRIRGL